MDTRFWGPSGWRLLHLITFTYEPIGAKRLGERLGQTSSGVGEPRQKESVRELFSMLPFVLPCKFCRASLVQYMRKEPLEPALKSRATLTRWLYKIHNHVNSKLRDQGLLKDADPSFADVKKVYEDRVAAGCIRTEFEGWDFLFSIADNHPFSQNAKNSSPMPPMTPMPDAPTGLQSADGLTSLKEGDLPKAQSADGLTPEEKNEFNLMTPEERMPYYKRFWESLAGTNGALPFLTWRNAWTTCGIRYETLNHRKTWIRELWRVRCCLEKELELVNHEEFGSLCKRLANHRSGCGSKTRGKTCRRKRITRKK